MTFIQIASFISEKSQMSCLLFSCMAHWKVKSTGISWASATQRKTPSPHLWEQEVQGRIMFSGRTMNGQGSLQVPQYHFKRQQLPFLGERAPMDPSFNQDFTSPSHLNMIPVLEKSDHSCYWPRCEGTWGSVCGNWTVDNCFVRGELGV